jgi:hypothetical protein
MAIGPDLQRFACEDSVSEVAISMEQVCPGRGTQAALSLYRPSQVVAGSESRVFVYDAGNGRILRFGSDGRHQVTIGNSGNPQQRLEVSPYSGALMALDARDSVFASVPASRFIFVYSADGLFLRSISLPFSQIAGMAVAPDGSLLVSPLSSRITATVFRFSPEGRLVASFGSRIVPVNGHTASQINASLLAVGRDGSVFQAFVGWPVVRKYRPDGTQLWEATYDVPPALRRVIPPELTLDNVRANPGREIAVSGVAFGVVPTLDGGCRIMTNGFGLVRIDPRGQVAGVRVIAVDPKWDDRFFSHFALSSDERTLLLLDNAGGRVFRVSATDTDRLFVLPKVTIAG